MTYSADIPFVKCLYLFVLQGLKDADELGEKTLPYAKLQFVKQISYK